MKARRAIVCAWCPKVLRDGAAPASHGICPGCKARQLSRAFGAAAARHAGAIAQAVRALPFVVLLAIAGGCGDEEVAPWQANRPCAPCECEDCTAADMDGYRERLIVEASRIRSGASSTAPSPSPRDRFCADVCGNLIVASCDPPDVWCVR